MVTPSTGGTITSIAIQPGQYVEAQQVLLRLNDVQETIKLERLRKEFHVQQINRLKNPHDLVAQQQLATLRLRQACALSDVHDVTGFQQRAAGVI
jgi:multidrug resistance efflux pump